MPGDPVRALFLRRALQVSEVRLELMAINLLFTIRRNAPYETVLWGFTFGGRTFDVGAVGFW
jgi:hypothetical protein